MHIPKQKLRKVGPKPKRCIFAGFDDNIKGYCAYDPDTRITERFRDVRFLSDEFNALKIPARVYSFQENSVQTDKPEQKSDDEVDKGVDPTTYRRFLQRNKR